MTFDLDAHLFANYANFESIFRCLRQISKLAGFFIDKNVVMLHLSLHYNLR